MSDCSFDRAKSAFLERGPVRPLGARPPGFDQASESAWEALAGYVRHRMEDGTVMVPDSLGRWHRLSPLHSRFSEGDLTACAFDDEGGCAVLSPALIGALASASFGIWCHPGFEPRIGDPTLIALPPIEPGIPLGFEQVALRGGQEPEARAMLEARRDWLGQAIGQLCPVRRTMAASTAWNAARWIWAHETGHLLCGHHLLHPNGRVDIRARFGQPDDDPPPTSGAELALEILADRFATRLLAAGARGNREEHLHALATGALLALALFEAEHVMSGRPWVTASHPGTWFRAQSLLDELETAVGRPVDWLPMLARLARVLDHCGLWLEPAIEGGRHEVADRFVEETLSSFAPHLERLRKYAALPVPDRSGASADRYSPRPT